MSWKQWTAVLVVIGGGIVLQIPRHDDMPMTEHQHDVGAMQSTEQGAPNESGPYRTVSLAVTGMT